METHWILTSDMLPMVSSVRLRGGIGEVDGGGGGIGKAVDSWLGFLDV
jgi:hypothetical protein